MTRHRARKSTVLNEVGRTIVLTMFYLLPDFYCFLNTFLAMFQGFLAQRTIILSQTCWRSTCSSSSDFSPKTTDARGVERAALAAPERPAEPLIPQGGPSPYFLPLPVRSLLSRDERRPWGLRRLCFWRVRRTSPLPPPSRFLDPWLLPELARGTHGNGGARQHTSKTFPEGKFKTPLVRTHPSAGGKSPCAEQRPRGHSGQVQFPWPGAADKERPEEPARSPGPRWHPPGRSQTRAAPGGGGGGGGGSRGTYKSRVPPEEPGRVFRAAAGVGARRGAAATTTTTTNSRAQNR